MKIKIIIKEIEGLAGKRKIMLKNKRGKDNWCLFSHPIKREDKRVLKIKNSFGGTSSVVCLLHGKEKGYIKAC